MSPEARRQLGFTILLIFVSLNYTFMSTMEQRFVGHIGADAMAAKSISYTMMGYFSGITCVFVAAYPPLSGQPHSTTHCRCNKIIVIACMVTEMQTAVHREHPETQRLCWPCACLPRLQNDVGCNLNEDRPRSGRQRLSSYWQVFQNGSAAGIRVRQSVMIACMLFG